MEIGEEYIYDGNDDYFKGRKCNIVDTLEDKRVLVEFEDSENYWMVMSGCLKRLI